MEEALIKRVLPHSVEAEQSVIGAMLMDQEAIIKASEIISGDDFYQHQYGIVFDAIVELYNDGKPRAFIYAAILSKKHCTFACHGNQNISCSHLL